MPSFCTRTWLGICLVCLFGLSWGASPNLAASNGSRYSFKALLDNTGPVTAIELPVINNAGVVAFGASTGGERAVFALDNDLLTRIGDSTRIPDFNPPSISGNGTIVVCAREANAGPGTRVVAWQSGELSEVVTRADGPFSDLNTLPAVNNHGYVVFWGRFVSGRDAILGRQIGGGPIQILNTGVNGPDQAPVLNASNTTAFVGSPSPVGGLAIFTSDRNGVTLRASDVGPFAIFSAAISLNDRGDLAFFTVLDSGDSGIFVSSKHSTAPLVLANHNLRSPQRPVINNRGEVAFMATLPNGATGIFTGPDPVLDKVVAPGDTIDGVVVDALDFFRGLNDRGQIVFTAQGRDGVQRLFRADPVR
jgi:hypothetical protein